MRDLYDILGVGRDVSPADLKKAYRRQAHQYHPDKNPDDKQAEELFKEAQRAYEILSDPKKRKAYDRFGMAGVEGGGFHPGAGPGGMGGPGGGPTGFSGQGFGDMFGEIFGDFFGSRKQRGAGTGAGGGFAGGAGAGAGAGASDDRGADRKLSLQIDFKTAVFGGERHIQVPRTKRCKTCSGTGAKPGTSPQLCQACGGAGKVRVQQGVLSLSKTCTYCNGRGRIISDPCSDCSGNGSTERVTRLKVRVPPGSDDGTTLRYAGEGEPSPLGGPGGRSGDLLVTLRVDPHPVFERRGRDIHCEVPVRFVNAALGGQVDVPTLEGTVRMKVPPGTQSGHVFRLRGKGVPSPHSGDARGDQHVTVRIEVPVNLNATAREHIEGLRDLGAEAHPEQVAFWDKVKKAE